MVKETLSSFKDNIKDRLTNPFLGTFIIVWIAHNWEIVYSFFYFDKSWNLENKLQYFKEYWFDKSFFWNLICVAAITIGILIITYLFLALSRFLANVFENIIVPNIQRISRGNIVTINIYQEALDKIILLEGKVEEERKAKNFALQERDELEKKLFSNLSKENFNQNEDINDKEIVSLINAAHSQFKEKEIEETLLDLTKRMTFSKNEKYPVIDFLLKHGLIVYDKEIDYGYPTYFFSERGEKFKMNFFEKKT